MPQQLILVINPGNTSTKVAVYDGTMPVCAASIKHADEELAHFADINAQKDFREDLVQGFLHDKTIDPAALTAIAARGGLLKPLASGTYVVDPRMVDDLIAARQGSHASNLAAQIGYSLAAKLGIPCYIVDPVSVDEAEPLARYSGHPLFTRVMLTHALNMKAVAKRFCARKETALRRSDTAGHPLGDRQLALAAPQRAHDRRRQSLRGRRLLHGPQRRPAHSAGGPLYLRPRPEVQRISKKWSSATAACSPTWDPKDFLKVRDKYLAGDAQTMEVVQAMAYQVAKEAGGLATVVAGKVDAILITGGIAFNDFFSEMIRQRIGFIAPVHVYPGEDEMQALVEGVNRVLLR